MKKVKPRSEETGPASFFLDTNVFMYASGAGSPLKQACLKILDEAATGNRSIRTSAEVVQEVLYRYSMNGRREFGIQLSEMILEAFDPVLPVNHGDIRFASELMSRYQSIRSRDAIHAAVAINNGITHFVSTDRDFDAINEIMRVHPREFAGAIS